MVDNKVGIRIVHFFVEINEREVHKRSWDIKLDIWGQARPSPKLERWTDIIVQNNHP
mgnify:FL=1